MGSSFFDVFGPFAVLVVLVLWLAIMVITIAAPFVMFSIAGSLRGIYRELVRLNGGPQVYATTPAATPAPPAPDASGLSLSHRLTR